MLLKKMARELEFAYGFSSESAQCPNIGGVLEPEIGYVHDVGNLLHAAVRVLRGAEGEARSRSILMSRRRVAHAVAQLGSAHAVEITAERESR